MTKSVRLDDYAAILLSDAIIIYELNVRDRGIRQHLLEHSRDHSAFSCKV